MLDISSYSSKLSYRYPLTGELYLISDYPVDPDHQLNHSCQVYAFNGEDTHGDMIFDLHGDDNAGHAANMFSGYDTYMIETNQWQSYVRDQRVWLLTKACIHLFPNNGFLLSWCKFCGKEGSFNRISCKFDEVSK